MLGHHEGAVGLRLDDRKTDVRQPGHRPPILQEVAARTLRSALENVSSDRPGSDAIPIFEVPAELMHQRSQGEPGVGDAARDDDVRAAP